MSTPALRVAAVTSTDPERHYTWHLRVGSLIELLRGQGIEVSAHRLPRRRRDWKTLLAELPPCDLVWLHRRILWPSEIRVLRGRGAPIVLDIDDPVGYSANTWKNFSLKNCLQFRATARHASVILAASRGLVNIARQYNANVHLTPLSADTPVQRLRTTPRRPGEPLRLLWLGTRSTFPYLEGIRTALDAIGRACPDACLRVVGHNELRLHRLPVENVRWSRDSEREALARCHVGLVPMAKDRWTQAKAAFKPLQYLANGMPFVGTPVGVNMDLCDGGRQGMLADTVDEWVQAVRTLASDEAMRLRMGRRGIQYVREHHAPAVLATQIAQIFNDLVDGAGLEPAHEPARPTLPPAAALVARNQDGSHEDE
jgi:glycosyltransferase involved in cell wall biosynthesis